MSDDNYNVTDESCMCMCVWSLISVVLSMSEFWHDRFLGSDDLERTDGCDWKRKPDCRCAQVIIIVIVLYNKCY